MAMKLTGKPSEHEYFLRDKGQNALDAAAFHYWVYHSLTRFLGMSGNLEAGYDLPLDWVNGVNQMILTNDLVNANTHEFDPRHISLPFSLSWRRGMSPFSKAASRFSSLSFEDFRNSHDSVAMSDIGISAAVKRRTVLIATMEYNIDDWNIRIRIGGLGVMAQLMGKTLLEHQDLIWVVPCVGGIDYPLDQRAASIYPIIMGKEYEVEVQYYRVGSITYVLLDAPVFSKQTKASPYPPRMDDKESAIYYSAWNYCIAETIRRFPVDLYHIKNYHGAAAPLYLLPERTILCALSLHDAEFQGLWPMRTPEESKEVSNVFNLDIEIVREYVQFGSVFNLLHAETSYLRIHQRGFGAVGVSKKYGDRSYARYPIFWGLSKIGQLPNPGPTAELFVFVGRWSLQKGVDLIADIFPSILEKHPKAQLICVGPVINLYGKFAALKLDKLMLKYPKRVYSKPEFTALPPYIFSGAEFALIPSRDEPFGLVAVEFGRKGALGVGARVGGLGQMPGFWYTIESMAPRHLLHQFRGAVVSALSTKTDTRVQMRAWSAKQRLPVAQWLEDLDKLQSEAIRLHTKQARMSKKITINSRLTVPTDLQMANERLLDDTEPTPPPSALVSRSCLPPSLFHTAGDSEDHSSSDSLVTMVNTAANNNAREGATSGLTSGGSSHRGSRPSLRESVESLAFRMMAPDSSRASRDIPPVPGSLAATHDFTNLRNSSRLSVLDVVGHRTDYKLQKVDPFFNDSTGEYYREFEQKLGSLSAKNSESELCIEEYLIKSERDWFKRFKDAKLGRSRSPSASPLPSILSETRASRTVSYTNISHSDGDDAGDEAADGSQEIRLGDWPIYSILLAFGQILSANSHQIVLLTGDLGQTASKLYMVAGTYGLTSILWWLVYRRYQSLYSLSLPWLFYGLAFLLLGILPFIPASDLVQDMATCLYATGASAGSLYFAVNFGDEGGAPGPSMEMVGNSSIPVALANTLPIAIILWVIGIVLFVGLPDYYRHSGTYIPNIPSFYKSLLRRNIVPWFLLTVVIQNYWLSTPYGRDWQFLFSSKYIPGWSAVILAVGFSVVVWALLLCIFSKVSLSHPWIVPMFGVGLGAPRWAQMLWGTSGIGLYLPWLGGSAVGCIGTCLEGIVALALGVLDTIQGVGVGMVLLLTLTRQHVAATLIGAQIIGSITAMVARATAPDRIGPGHVFPNFSAGITPGITKVWFWAALCMQLLIPFGYFKVFRKEQVAKP
ncbi:hypothetical protein VSDG_09894 [Cytospora chrysosperma]|uniref:alpha-1,3-glucan synthase n=1 Tax=Cytospora chrysosperma TaxID=252740 RepID=A0A423V8W5_CYTCH|nr:hypothetical protein VSDG_09894 [Valsa sordida]